MCTYQTERVDLSGSGKGADGWFSLSAATVYFDHPVHAGADHTLNIDFINPACGPSARVAVELSPSSARALAGAILAALDAAAPFIAEALVDEGLVDEGPPGDPGAARPQSQATLRLR